MVNHVPFDFGSMAVISALTGQKTIKAVCGKRVAFQADAMARHIDCEECRTRLNDRMESNSKLMSYVPVGDKSLATLILEENRFIRALLRQ